MTPVHRPGNEPDATDMATFDPEADTRPTPATMPEPGDETGAVPDDRA